MVFVKSEVLPVLLKLNDWRIQPNPLCRPYCIFIKFYIQLLCIDTLPLYVSIIWVLAYIKTKRCSLTPTLTFFHFNANQHLLQIICFVPESMEKTPSKIRILYQNWNQPAQKIKLFFSNVPHRLTVYKTGFFDRKRQRWELIH